MKTVITVLIEHKEPLPKQVCLTDRLADLAYMLIAKYGKTAEVTATVAEMPVSVLEMDK